MTAYFQLRDGGKEVSSLFQAVFISFSRWATSVLQLVTTVMPKTQKYPRNSQGIALTVEN
jgi:hypothetical protein